MSDFSDRPFVAGSLVGLRAFDVDTLGRLTGPTYGGVFKPGENVADCLTTQGWSMQLWQMDASLARMTGKPVPPRPEVTQKKAAAKHPVAARACGCGFYAYFDGTNTYAKADRVSAVIEGYGVCTVGTRGFRAEKARLLAIVDPSMRRWWQSWKFNVAMAVFMAALLTKNIAGHNWWLAGMDVVVVVMNVISAVLNLRTQRKQATNLALIRRHYPDVPRYRTQRAALKAHRLTPPEPITPETADDFWTRSAS